MVEKFKTESMILVGTWAKTLEQNKSLLDCITNLDLLGIDICLVSHYPVSTTIQDLVSYYIYDKYNEISVDETQKSWRWNYYPIDITFKSLKNSYTPHSAVLYLIRNGFYLAKAINKKYVFYTESDTIINSKDLDSFYKIYKETLKGNKRAWFTPWILTPTGTIPTAFDINFWFSEIDFILDNIDFYETNWEHNFGIEAHIFGCLNNVKNEYILDSDGNNHAYHYRFPNSIINKDHGGLSQVYKITNSEIKNFHLLGSLLLSKDKKHGLKPLLIIINHWPDTIKEINLGSNDMFKNKNNNFKVSYFVDNKLEMTDEVNLFVENTSYYRQLSEIHEGKDYEIKVELYNEYNRCWDVFYEEEYTFDDIEDMKSRGDYNLYD